MKMPITILLLLVAAAAMVNSESTHLGCWRDTGSRAILGGYLRLNIHTVIQDCEARAANAGVTIFSVQDGNACFAADKNAANTYQRYGRATNCRNGRGGPWANDVYQVKPAFQCTRSDTGQQYGSGESYINDNGKKCVCGSEGFVCLCEDAGVTCTAGTTKWTDQNTCEAKCIKDAAYCSSSGDPHYLSFDRKYYDFHGKCTYQAASCDDFVVYFKNVDLLGRAPRYTKRAELHFKGKIFAIENGYNANVDGQQVQVPYVKTYTTGDSVKILNNGQLEIVLYQNRKGRIPAVRVRANNAGRYVNAELWLHGSCSDETEGMCGNWNGNSADDLPGGSANTLGELHEVYDENCPKPPDPFHPCDMVDNGHAEAAAICDALKQAPFTSCHSAVSIGDKDGGIYKNCMTDVCNCFIDQSCACDNYDNYASSCIEAGIDLADWRKDVSYCPYNCPDGLAYHVAASIPAPTCLNKNPEEEGTARGCFCPSGQFLQDNVCVDESECRCIYEGKFYEVGDGIEKEGECQTCTCQGGGNMDCRKSTCPSLTCAGDEIQAEKDDLCCPYCDADWVQAVNADVVVNKGQNVALTCAVQTKGVLKRDISWQKDGVEISNGISENRLVLKIADAGESEDGEYTCQAVKNGKTGRATFNVEVKIPVTPSITIKPVKTIVNCKAGKKGCKVQCKIATNDGTKLNKKKVKVCLLKDGKKTKCKKAKGKAPNFKRSLGKKKTIAGNYVCVAVDAGGETFTSEAITVNVS